MKYGLYRSSIFERIILLLMQWSSLAAINFRLNADPPHTKQ